MKRKKLLLVVLPLCGLIIGVLFVFHRPAFPAHANSDAYNAGWNNGYSYMEETCLHQPIDGRPMNYEDNLDYQNGWNDGNVQARQDNCLNWGNNPNTIVLHSLKADGNGNAVGGITYRCQQGSGTVFVALFVDPENRINRSVGKTATPNCDGQLHDITISVANKAGSKPFASGDSVSSLAALTDNNLTPIGDAVTFDDHGNQLMTL